MATWKRQGAVLKTKGGAQIKGVLFTTNSVKAAAPAAKPKPKPKPRAGTVASANRKRKKHGRQ